MMSRRLVFKCGRCRKVTCVTATWAASKASRVACGKCGRQYELPFDPSRDPSSPAYTERIKQVADEQGVDLPTACSIVEGIIKGRGVPARASASRPVDKRSPLPLVVTIGVLALAIVATQWRRAETLPAVPENPVREAATVGHQDAPPQAPAPPPVIPDPIQTQTDPFGRLTRITGPNPEAVLRAFCAHESHAGKLVPRDVIEATPPSPGARVGILESLDDLQHPKSVNIYRARQSHRWVIGNGMGPIEPRPAPTTTIPPVHPPV